jgi:hypothetical protein
VSADPAAAAPSGVVTFLLTDVEGSTRRWEADAQAMRAALVVHDKVLRTAIEAYDGFLFSHTGDGFVAVFASPMSAVNAAIDAQRDAALTFPAPADAVEPHDGELVDDESIVLFPRWSPGSSTSRVLEFALPPRDQSPWELAGFLPTRPAGSPLQGSPKLHGSGFAKYAFYVR